MKTLLSHITELIRAMVLLLLVILVILLLIQAGIIDPKEIMPLVDGLGSFLSGIEETVNGLFESN